MSRYVSIEVTEYQYENALKFLHASKRPATYDEVRLLLGDGVRRFLAEMDNLPDEAE